MNSSAEHSLVPQTLPDMGIAGIPLLHVPLPHHILCVYLQLLCQHPFSYGVNSFRWYVVKIMFWRPGKCHPCQVEAEGATKRRGHWQCLRVLLLQSNMSLTLHFVFSIHEFPSPTILCQFYLVSSVQVKKETILSKKGTGIFGQYVVVQLHDWDPCVLLQFKEEQIVWDYEKSAPWLCLCSPISHLISLCLTSGWEQ